MNAISKKFDQKHQKNATNGLQQEISLNKSLKYY